MVYVCHHRDTVRRKAAWLLRELTHVTTIHLVSIVIYIVLYWSYNSTIAKTVTSTWTCILGDEGTQTVNRKGREVGKRDLS